MLTLKFWMSLLATAALLALAWVLLGSDSAIRLAIATAVVLVVMVIWTVRRDMKRERTGGEPPADGPPCDPRG